MQVRDIEFYDFQA